MSTNTEKPEEKSSTEHGDDGHVHGPHCSHGHHHHHHQGPQTPFVRALPKVGRNDACPCGSGQKFKKCCGK